MQWEGNSHYTASHFGGRPGGVSPTYSHIENIGCEFPLSLFLRTCRENIHPSVSLLKNDHTLAGLKQQTFLLSSCGARTLQRSCLRATPLQGLQEGTFPCLSDFWCLLTASLQPTSVFKVTWPSSLHVSETRLSLCLFLLIRTVVTRFRAPPKSRTISSQDP